MGLSTSTKVGIFVLIALTALSLVITWKSNLLLRAGGYELVGSFTDIEGLTIGSEVRYRGYKVGKVIKIDPGPEDIKIYSIINRDIRVPEDSTLRVAFDGLVGLKFLSVRPGKSNAFYRPGSRVLDGRSTAGIVDFVDVGTQSLVEVKKILENILMMVEDTQIQNAFKKAVLNIEKITEQLESSSRALNDVISDRQFQANIKGTIGETKKTLASANSFFESIGQIHLKPRETFTLAISQIR
jgi:phospholipid/cholesterol/gamma-HCH transport system substrate-binding protein